MGVGAEPVAASTRRGVSSCPPWVSLAAAALVAGSFSQIAHAVRPRKGPFIGYLEVVSCGVLLVWGIWTLATGRFKRLRLPPWPVWGLLAMTVLSFGGATDLKASSVELAQYLLYFLGLYTLFSDAFENRASWALIALAVGAAVSVFVAAGQETTGATAMRIRGLTGDRNVYSAYMAVVLPLLWSWAMARWPRKSAWLGVAGCTAAALTMVGPPHVWIALVAMAWASGVLLGRNWWRPFAPMAALVVLVNLVAPAHRASNFDEILNPWETATVYKLPSGTGSLSQVRLVKKRWIAWYPALALIADHPVLGCGAGNYQENIGMAQYWGYMPNAKKAQPDTDNLYLVMGGDLGLAGLVCLVALFLWHIVAVQPAAARGDVLAVGLAASLTSLAAVNVFTALLVRGATVGWVAMFALAAMYARAGRAPSKGGDETAPAAPPSSPD